jgi:PKD repeat protein
MEENSKSKMIGAVILIVIVIIASVVAYYYFNLPEAEDGNGGGGGGGGDNNLPRAVMSTNWTANTRVNELIEFNASKSSDTDGEIDTYIWDFGDGSKTRSGPLYEVVNHSYASAGTYKVNLTVEDDKGGRDSASKTITIRGLDYTSDESVIVTANANLPMPNEHTFQFPVEDDVVRANITLTLIGGSGSSDDGFSGSVEITVTDEFAMNKLDNASVDVRPFATQGYEYYREDLFGPGNYLVTVVCISGTVSVQFEIEVNY